ncbi:MAG: tetratricopeptide repeat protein [Oceanibaculum sp.]
MSRMPLSPSRPALLLAGALAALALPALAHPALAQSGAGIAIDHESHYAACMRLAQEAPVDGYKSGTAWFDKGGGSAAEHCIAVALLQLGDYAEAAARLERVAADESLAPRPETRAGLLAQAGLAWVLAGDERKAAGARDKALEITPDNVDLRIDRALSRMALEQYFEAIDDLNRALDLEPRRMDALLVRASAYRYLGQIDLARDDVERALGIDPDHPDALLERGVIARTAGDKDAARKDFLAVLHLTAEGPASDAARLNLEAMDVRVE